MRMLILADNHEHLLPYMAKTKGSSMIHIDSMAHIGQTTEVSDPYFLTPLLKHLEEFVWITSEYQRKELGSSKEAFHRLLPLQFEDFIRSENGFTLKRLKNLKSSLVVPEGLRSFRPSPHIKYWLDIDLSYFSFCHGQERRATFTKLRQWQKYQVNEISFTLGYGSGQTRKQDILLLPNLIQLLLEEYRPEKIILLNSKEEEIVLDHSEPSLVLEQIQLYLISNISEEHRILKEVFYHESPQAFLKQLTPTLELDPELKRLQQEATRLTANSGEKPHV